MTDKIRVGLLHNTLNVMGGAARLTLDLIPLLHERSMRVHLATFDKVRWDSVRRMFGDVELPETQTFLIPFQFRVLGIYQRILMRLIANRLQKNSDVVVNTHSDFQFCRSDIVYMHGVTPLGASGGVNEEVFERYQTPLMRLYFLPYRYLLRSKMRSYSDNDGMVFVANSKYTQERMRKNLMISKSRVIYPAINTSRYGQLAGNESREKQVVTIARFTREKNLQLIPEIASKCPDDIKFAIVTASAGVSDDFMQEFNYMRKKFGVESRVNIFMDIQFEEKLNILRRSRVYLHLMPGEHFGIALAEACSAGCMPVAVKGGGQEEIVEGIPHSVYDDPGHAADLIRLAVGSWTPQKSRETSAMMERFSKKNFSDEFCSLVEDVYTSKRR
jgi:glycosyltransferase involved in cell wall biosynthesis